MTENMSKLRKVGYEPNRSILDWLKGRETRLGETHDERAIVAQSYHNEGSIHQWIGRYTSDSMIARHDKSIREQTSACEVMEKTVYGVIDRLMALTGPLSRLRRNKQEWVKSEIIMIRKIKEESRAKT